jgi:hypothetical protein
MLINSNVFIKFIPAARQKVEVWDSVWNGSKNCIFDFRPAKLYSLLRFLVSIPVYDLYCNMLINSPLMRSSSVTGLENIHSKQCADHATPSIRKSWYYFAKKWRSLGRYSSLSDQSHGRFFFSYRLIFLDPSIWVQLTPLHDTNILQ